LGGQETVSVSSNKAKGGAFLKGGEGKGGVQPTGKAGAATYWCREGPKRSSRGFGKNYSGKRHV